MKHWQAIVAVAYKGDDSRLTEMVVEETKCDQTMLPLTKEIGACLSSLASIKK